jgi:hypothetical protein
MQAWGMIDDRQDAPPRAKIIGQLGALILSWLRVWQIHGQIPPWSIFGRS